MKLDGKTIKTTCFTRYCKAKLGYASREGVGLYELVCMALEVDEMPMPMNMTAKQWAAANLDHILGKHDFEKAKSRPVPTSKPKRVGYYRPKILRNKKLDGADVTSDAFLSTYAWRKLRMEALKKYGARCQCCGATPADGAVMNVDHIKPRKKWPSLALDLNNLQVLCHDCNHGKGNWDETDWRSAAS